MLQHPPMRETPVSLVEPGARVFAKKRQDAVVNAAIRVDIMTTFEAFEELGPEWKALFTRSARGPHVYQSYNWCWHFLTAYSRNHGASLAIATARHNGNLQVIWPMMVTQQFGCRMLEWLGEPMGQYGDILCAMDAHRDQQKQPPTEQYLTALFQAIRAQIKPDFISLRRVRDDANIKPWLDAIGATRTANERAPAIAIENGTTFEDFCAERFSGKSRKKKRRAWRVLEDRAELRLETFAPSPQAAAIADQAIQLKRAWLQERGIVSRALSTSSAETFFHAVCSQTDHPVDAEIHALYSGNDLASVQIYFAHDGYKCLHLIVYDLALERFSCGQLHLEATFRQSFDAASKTIDMLPPEAAYKTDWANETCPVRDYVIACTLRGRAVAEVYQHHLRPRIKASIDRIPLGLRRRLFSFF